MNRNEEQVQSREDINISAKVGGQLVTNLLSLFYRERILHNEVLHSTIATFLTHILAWEICIDMEFNTSTVLKCSGAV